MILLFISCGDTTDTPITDITAIKINESNTTIYSTDAPTNPSARVYYADGSTADVTNEVKWSSSNEAVASVLKGSVQSGSNNGGDVNISISYKNITALPSLVRVTQLIDYNISILNADANTTGTYNLLAIGVFDDNTTKTIIKNINLSM